MKQVYLLAIILALTLSAEANVVPPSGYTGDWWQPTTVYVAGNIVEYEPLEEYYLAWGEVGLTNVGFEPNLNPQIWQDIGPEQAAPEPTSLILLGSGILGVGALVRRIKVVGNAD